MMSTYLTGDTHGSLERIEYFIKRFQIAKTDTIVILGDVGMNYFGTDEEKSAKKLYNSYGPTILAIQGNHEERPYNIAGYETKMWNGGLVYYQREFPNLLFAKDGEVYNIEGKKCMPIGGAYSVDKWLQILRCYLYHSMFLDEQLDADEYERALLFVQGKISDKNYKIRDSLTRIYNSFPSGICGWFKEEQPSDEIKSFVEAQIKKDNKINIIFSHTCPSKYTPVEMFLSCINQETVDDSTELWLDKLEERIDYDKWYCGHWHTNKKIDKMVFLFEDFAKL